MPNDKKTIEPINADFDDVAKAMVSTPKEISLSPNKISILASKTTSKEISPSQGSFDLGIEMDAEFGEIGMGVQHHRGRYLYLVG